MNKAKSTCLTILIASHSMLLLSQSNTSNGWVVSNHEQKISEKISFKTDVQFRSANQFKYVEAVLLRPYLVFSLTSKHSLGAGYAYLGNKTIESNQQKFQIEHRIWQQFQIENKWNKSEITNRVRLEQRFIQKEAAFNFVQRFRYYARFQSAIFKGSADGGFFVGLQNEIFLNIQNKEVVNDKLFDQNRVYAGLGFRFSQAVAIEAGYIYRYQIEDKKMHHHIIQFAFNTSF